MPKNLGNVNASRAQVALEEHPKWSVERHRYVYDVHPDVWIDRPRSSGWTCHVVGFTFTSMNHALTRAMQRVEDLCAAAHEPLERALALRARGFDARLVAPSGRRREHELWIAFPWQQAGVESVVGEPPPLWQPVREDPDRFVPGQRVTVQHPCCIMEERQYGWEFVVVRIDAQRKLAVCRDTDGLIHHLHFKALDLLSDTLDTEHMETGDV